MDKLIFKEGTDLNGKLLIVIRSAFFERNIDKCADYLIAKPDKSVVVICIGKIKKYKRHALYFKCLVNDKIYFFIFDESVLVRNDFFKVLE